MISQKFYASCPRSLDLYVRTFCLAKLQVNLYPCGGLHAASGKLFVGIIAWDTWQVQRNRYCTELLSIAFDGP